MKKESHPLNPLTRKSVDVTGRQQGVSRKSEIPTAQPEEQVCMDRFFHPKNIAIIGFSLKEGNQGQGVLSNLERFGYRGDIYLVGRSGGDYYGREILPSVEALPERVDLAVILTAPAAVPEILEACGEHSIRSVCIATGGFDELMQGGSPLTRSLREIAEKWKIHFTGPNGFGVINPAEGVFIPFGGESPEWLGPGRVSFISHSGGLLYHVGNLLTSAGMGTSLGVSMGNKVNLNESDFLPYFQADPGTDVILLYLESISKGRELIQQALRSEKPILMLKSGRTQASQKALQSHTAAMSTDDRVVDAMARQAGILRVDDFRQMIQLTRAFGGPQVRGNQLLILARSGGAGVMAVDEAIAHGFDLIEFPDAYTRELKKYFKEDVIQPCNPLDLGTIFKKDVWLELVESACLHLRPDAILLAYISQPDWPDDQVARFNQQVQSLGRQFDIPIALVVNAKGAQVASLECQTASLVYGEVGEAVRSLATVRDWNQRRKTLASKKFKPVLPNSQADRLSVSPLLPEALRLIEKYGLPAAPWDVAQDLEQAVQVAERLGYPLALKVIAAEISHKTDLGGVVLGISGEASLKESWQSMLERLCQDAPKVHLEGFLLQKMAEAGKEMIVGARRDPTFGPVVLLGLGGIYAEIFQDFSLRIAPLDLIDAQEMVAELKSSHLLQGVRGEKPANVEALCRSLLAVSRLMLDHPEVRELDINPLLVTPNGVVALDARIVTE